MDRLPWLALMFTAPRADMFTLLLAVRVATPPLLADAVPPLALELPANIERLTWVWAPVFTVSVPPAAVTLMFTLPSPLKLATPALSATTPAPEATWLLP